jgi:hypothetical protein
VPKVITVKGFKQVGQITSRERGELVTLCGIVFDDCVALPTIFVFPRKPFRDTLMGGAPEGSFGLVHESGWMTSGNFWKVLEHFVKNVNASKENECILTMDNHDSHLSLECVIYAKEHGVHIVTLPPHTSNKTQPLDIIVYGPFKTCFNNEANSWVLRNPGKTISIYNMAELVGNAWMKSATPVNIISGFKTPGIWPTDRNAFEREGYLPSTVTDRMLNGQSGDDNQHGTSHSRPAVGHDDEPMSTEPSTSSVDRCTNAASTPHQDSRKNKKNSLRHQKKFVAFPRCHKDANRRKRGKAMEATSTPEIKRIRLELEVR